MRAICILGAASILTGCATRSSDIGAAYVSIQYQASRPLRKLRANHS